MSVVMQNYTNVYRHTEAETATPTKLIVMLYNGMIRFLKEYKKVVETKESGNGINWIEKAHQCIFKTTQILQALTISLNEKEGEDIALNLKTIYAYLYEKLVIEDLNKTSKIVDEVLNILVPLRDSWVEVEKNARQQMKEK